MTERNGFRPRVLSTKAGDLQLRIPKLRKGSFFPTVLEPRRRIDQAMYAVVMEAYVLGVATRSVDQLVEALGIETGISKSEASRICAGIDVRVGAFRNRTLGDTEFVYVYLAATYVHVRDRVGRCRGQADRRQEHPHREAPLARAAKLADTTTGTAARVTACMTTKCSGFPVI